MHADDDLIGWNHEKIADSIASSKAAEDEEDTLFRRLSSAKNSDGTPLSPNYIASELYDNLNAAQVTVAITLTYIVYHLSEHPMWQTKICDEMTDLMSKSEGFPSFASINSAPILDAFIREVYRINPGTGGHAERVVPEGGKMYNRIYIPEGVRLSLPSVRQCLFSVEDQIKLTVPLGARDSLNHRLTPGRYRLSLSK